MRRRAAEVGALLVLLGDHDEDDGQDDGERDEHYERDGQQCEQPQRHAAACAAGVLGARGRLLKVGDRLGRRAGASRGRLARVLELVGEGTVGIKSFAALVVDVRGKGEALKHVAQRGRRFAAPCELPQQVIPEPVRVLARRLATLDVRRECQRSLHEAGQAGDAASGLGLLDCIDVEV